MQRFEYADERVPFAMTMNGKRYHLHYDHLGSLRAVTDINRTIVKAIVYDAYGNIVEDSNESFAVPFGFAGGLHDRDTALVHFGYREYDPFTGRWTAKDPIGFGGGDSNLYGYVLNDPVNLVDPWGLFPWVEIFMPTPLGEGSDLIPGKKRLRYNTKTGKWEEFNYKTGKYEEAPKYKCETRVPSDWKPPKSPTQKPPSGGTPKTFTQKMIRWIEILLRVSGHWK